MNKRKRPQPPTLGHATLTSRYLLPRVLIQRCTRVLGSLRNNLIQFVRYVPTNNGRVALYRLLGMRVGKRVFIGSGCIILGGAQRITIGAGSIINQGVTLDGRCPLTIGTNVSISIYTLILTLEHDLNAADFQTVGSPVTIGDRVFLGARSLIVPGVEIGYGACVAAGAVVTKDVEPYTIVAGVPAKEIASRTKTLTYNWVDK